MTHLLSDYIPIVGEDVINQLKQLSCPLSGKSIVHINSTRVGGGVAEILENMLMLMKELGLESHWEVIDAGENFFKITKKLHNSLQGWEQELPEDWYQTYLEVNQANAERLKDLLENADMVFIHDPQPLPLIQFFPNRKGKWVWRCHIDLSRPVRSVWKNLKGLVSQYNASIFSLLSFAQPLEQPMYIIPPSIDPLSEKNIPLADEELERSRQRFGLKPEVPLLAQVSRFDRFKDPLGVVKAYQLVKKYRPVQLVLAGGGATDDPEAEQVLEELKADSQNDPDIHILDLAPESDRTINALQRLADIVLQKSLKEGFGLTVTEALWKGKPVIGGNVGGIKLQVINYHTGFLVDSPEGAALRIRYLLNEKALAKEMGRKGQKFVKENFLITRHVRDYLTLIAGLIKGGGCRLQLD